MFRLENFLLTMKNIDLCSFLIDGCRYLISLIFIFLIIYKQQGITPFNQLMIVIMHRNYISSYPGNNGIDILRYLCIICVGIPQSHP